MADRRIFKSNPTDRLAYDNEQFKLRIDEIAFSSPTTYFRIKKEFLKALVHDTITNVHNTVYNALTTGTTAAGGNNYIFPEANLPADLRRPAPDENLSPKIPEEEADQIAMNVAKTLKDIYSKEVVDRIFKTENISMALERASRKAEIQMN